MKYEILIFGLLEDFVGIPVYKNGEPLAFLFRQCTSLAPTIAQYEALV
jgi:hypothetical protein